MKLWLFFILAPLAFATDISVSKDEMTKQLELMRKSGQINEQQLIDAKAAVSGMSDQEMQNLTNLGLKQVQQDIKKMESELSSD